MLCGRFVRADPRHLNRMTAYLLANHLLNFLAPAAVVALLLVSLTRPFSRLLGAKTSAPTRWWTQFAIGFVVNLGVLTAGLLVFGHDGQMLTYAALVLGAAICQWCLLRGWKA